MHAALLRPRFINNLIDSLGFAILILQDLISAFAISDFIYIGTIIVVTSYA